MEDSRGEEKGSIEEMALNDPSREELLSKVARLEARNEQLEAENTLLQQELTNKTAQDVSAREEDRPTKKQKTSCFFVKELGRMSKRSSHHPSEEQQQQLVVARDTSIQILLTELLGRALDFLEFSDRRDFFIGSHDLWKRVRVAYETKIMVDLILDSTPTHAFLCRDYSSVYSLNMGSHGSDTALALLSHKRAFLQLQHLAMAGSMNVTDQDLALLSMNPIRCQKLLSIDVTGCLGTTFKVTFFLAGLTRQPPYRETTTQVDGWAGAWPSGRRTVFYADGIHARYGTNARGTFPAQGFPRPEDVHSIPVNSGCVLNQQGGVCTRDDPKAFVFVNLYNMSSLDTLSPPQAVLNRCRDHVEREKAVVAGRDQEAVEREVHVLLDGNQNDEPPAYWFQQN